MRLAIAYAWFIGTFFISAAYARDLYVDPLNGADTNDGLAAQLQGSGPLKTIAKAISLARAGDTIHLAPGTHPIRQSAIFQGVAGEPDKPVTLDGYGATLSGCDPINPADWTQVQPGSGLYRNDRIYTTLGNLEFTLPRVFMVFDGQMQRMGRTSKGTKTPFKKPANLSAGEWTFEPQERAFYVRIRPEQSLDEARIEFPVRASGVVIRGKNNHDLVIRNIVACHFANDAFTLHNESDRMLFENIGAYENGDDGFTAHETCRAGVRNYWAARNSTGIANTNQSQIQFENIYLIGNHAFEVLAANASVTRIQNGLIITNAQQPVRVYGTPAKSETGRLTLENVLIRVAGEKTKRLDVSPNGVLEARRLTTVGLSWIIKGQAQVDQSILAGLNAFWECADASHWKAGQNVYGLARFVLAGETYRPDAFERFQAAVKQDAQSRYRSFSSEQMRQWEQGTSSDVGAETATMRLPIDPRARLQ